MKLKLIIIKILFLYSLSTCADDFIVKINLPSITSATIKKELNDLKKHIKDNILTSMEVNVANNLTIECNRAPHITKVEYYIQPIDYSQPANNGEFPHISDNTKILSLSDFHYSGSLKNCQSEKFLTIVSLKIDIYFSKLMSSKQNDSDAVSVFYLKTQPKLDGKMDIEYFTKASTFRTCI